MNIFKYELSASRKSFIIWNVSNIAFLFFMMSMLPGFSDDSKALLEMLKDYPPELMKALGVDSTSIISTLGFYTYLMTYALLIGSIQAMNLGLSLISKENRMKTADFLLTKPVKRSTVFFAKFSTGLVNIVLTSCFYIGMSFFICQLFQSDTYSSQTLILMASSLFFVQLSFLTMGIMVSTILKKIKSIVSVSMGIVFSFFIIGMLDSLLGEGKARYLSPFKFFDFGYILKHQHYEGQYIAFALLISILFTLIGYFIYQRKDIPSS